MMNPQNPPHIAAFLDHVPEINHHAFIAPTAAVIGAVRIGADSSIWYQVTVRGDNHYIIIGTGTNIQDNSCIHISSREFPTIIGNNVSVGHSALVHACTLKDHSFVGMGAIVMDGAVIESDAMLAPRTIDTRKTHPVRRVMGWPAGHENAHAHPAGHCR